MHLLTVNGLTLDVLLYQRKAQIDDMIVLKTTIFN